MILQRRQSAEDAARARYKALIVKGAIGKGKPTDAEIAEMDELTVRFGYAPADFEAHLLAIAEVARLRPIAATMEAVQADRHAAAKEVDEISKEKTAAVEKFNAAILVADTRQNAAMERARQAGGAVNELERLIRAYPWLLSAEGEVK